MWEARALEVSSGKRIRLLQDGSPLSFRQLFTLLEEKPDFRAWYSQVLVDSAPDAFFWEHPPFTSETFDNEAEFVLCKARHLIDGLVFGTEDYVNRTFALSREYFGAARKSGARKLRRVQTVLRTMRDLQRDAMSA